MFDQTGKQNIVLSALPTTLLIVALEVLARVGAAFPYPSVLLYAGVLYAAFRAGRVAGLLSSAIAVLYEALAFSEPGHILVYSSTNLWRLLAAAISTPLLAFIAFSSRKHLIAGIYRLAKGEAKVKADELVEQEHFQMATVLEQLPFGVVIVNDAMCKISFANLEAVKLLGHDVTEFHPFGWGRMFHANGQPYTAGDWPLLRSFQNGEIIEEEEFLYAAKGGHLKPMSARTAPVRDIKGNIVAATMVFHDVIDRRRAELAQMELDAIVAMSDDAIFSLTLEGLILTWNPAAERIFGYTAEEVHSQPLRVLLPQDRRDELPAMLDRIKQGAKIAPFETVRRSRDGEEHRISLRMSPVLDASGHPKAATAIARALAGQAVASV